MQQFENKSNLAEVFAWMNERKSKYYKIGWAYLQNQFDIEDVFQNTILLASEKKHQLREVRYFETWVTRIFINECNRIYKQRKRISLTTMEDRTDDFQSDNLSVDVFDHLEHLDPHYKEVIVLKYISGFTQEEIAEILGVAVGTVKSRISRGFKELRKLMKRGEN